MSYTSTGELLRVLPFFCCSCFSLEILKFELYSPTWRFILDGYSLVQLICCFKVLVCDGS